VDYLYILPSMMLRYSRSHAWDCNEEAGESVSHLRGFTHTLRCGIIPTRLPERVD